jgi:hypothetical protein
MSTPQSDRDWLKALAPYRWPLAILGVGVLALLGWLASLWLFQRAYERTLTGSGQVLERATQEAGAIAAKFRTGTITHTFEAAIPQISGVGSGNLELATAEQVETFRAEDAKSVLWDWIYLGRTVSELRVPVTYRYHLRLADPWHLETAGQTCIVYAPTIRPSLPPAIHTDRSEKRSDAGWARFNAREQMDALEKTVTPTLVQYASDPRHLALVREECRKTVAAFVRTWLLQEDHWRKDRFHTIKVIFPDEPVQEAAQMPPTLRLD